MPFLLGSSVFLAGLITVTHSINTYPILQCDFSIDTCGWTTNPPWSLEFTVYLPSPLSPIPRKIQSDGGGFLVAQGRFGSDPSGDVILPLHKDNRARILSYKLIKPSGAAKLEILLHDDVTNRVLDTVAANSAVNWQKASTVIPPMDRDGNLIFRVSSVYDSFDFIGIDDITVNEITTNVIDAGQNNNKDRGNRQENAVFRKLDVSREVRRSPVKNVLATCKAIRCTFDRTSCAWTYSGFRPLDGKMVSETEGAGLISSEPVILPLNGHFQMDLYASEHTIVSILQRTGSREELLWTQSGLLMQKGWNKIRMPLRFSNLPSSIEIRTHTANGQFVAVTNTNLVDELGRDLACGLNIPAIRPQRDETTIRLTAVQQVTETKEESAGAQKTPTQSVDANPVSIGSGIPSSIPATTFKEQYLPSRLIPPAQSQQHMIRAQKKPTVTQEERQELTGGVRVIERNEPVVPVPPLVRSAPPMLGVATVTESSLAEQLLAENPQIRHQLKLLAKRFGLEGLSSAELGARLGSIAKLLGVKPEGNPIFKPPEGAKPITPINNTESPLASALPNINGALISQLSKFLELPAPNNIESRPFTRKNMDLIVQNAFNKYMQNARP